MGRVAGMKYAYLILCCMSLSGCSEYSVGWQSHPSSAYPENANDMYLNSTNRKMQVEQASGVKSNDSKGEMIWIWQKEFWGK